MQCISKDKGAVYLTARVIDADLEEPNPEEINLDDTDEVEEAVAAGSLDLAADNKSANPEEIPLDEISADEAS